MKKQKEIKNRKISKALKIRHKARIQEKINTDPDFIYSKKFNNSLAEIIKKYPNGVPDNLIAKVLKLKTSQYNNIFNKILSKLRDSLKAKD
jgi:hypothetical protein